LREAQLDPAGVGQEVAERYMLVPGLTDAADVEKVARFTSTLAHVERVEVLPFHQLGAANWADLQLPYQLANVPPPAPELVRRAEDQFRAHGLTVV
jgi:pyruvate formate lyase activating enzyme